LFTENKLSLIKMEIIKPDLKKAVEALKEGKVLVCPTDTVYGLICDAKNRKAKNRIFLIKQRSRRKPLPVFVKNIIMAKKLAKINQNQQAFLKKVWPGQTTVILRSRKTGTIGLRVPDNKFIIDLVKRIGPLLETSANLSGLPPALSVKDVLGQFDGRPHQPDILINGGKLKTTKPSRVVDLIAFDPVILRE
jgi:L-threonylcarbamoyladenylate synthase